jgi:hypothetical protein
MPTKTMLAKNATRQPQAKNCSSGSSESKPKAAVPSSSLGPASVETPPTLGRVLHRHQDRPTVLATNAYALEDAHYD